MRRSRPMNAGDMVARLDSGGTVHVDDFAAGSGVHPYADGAGFLPTWVVRAALAAHYGHEQLPLVLKVVSRVPNPDEVAAALLGAALISMRTPRITRDLAHPLTEMLTTLAGPELLAELLA